MYQSGLQGVLGATLCPGFVMCLSILETKHQDGFENQVQVDWGSYQAEVSCYNCKMVCASWVWVNGVYKINYKYTSLSFSAAFSMNFCFVSSMWSWFFWFFFIAVNTTPSYAPHPTYTILLLAEHVTSVTREMTPEIYGLTVSGSLYSENVCASMDCNKGRERDRCFMPSQQVTLWPSSRPWRQMPRAERERKRETEKNLPENQRQPIIAELVTNS